MAQPSEAQEGAQDGAKDGALRSLGIGGQGQRAVIYVYVYCIESAAAGNRSRLGAVATSLARRMPLRR